MKKNKLFWILTVICVLNFAAHLYFYPSLPDIVPTHWGASGQVNGWGPKSTVLFLAAIPFVTLILFEVIRNIDPFGCRTPWALNDEHNWQRTQRMGGYTFVVMGIVLLVLAFLGGLLGDIATLIVLLVAVFGGSAWIYSYSYLVYIGKMK